MRKKNVVLYFTKDGMLSEAQQAEMDSIPGARHRNSGLISPDDKCEPCTGVAGPDIPAQYSHLPVIEGTVLEDADTEEEDDTEGDDFDSMTAAQLKARLDEAGVEYPATAKKAALVALCQEHLIGE